SISAIQDEERRVVVQGEVFKTELKELKSGRKLLTFNITDYTNSIACKFFVSPREKEQEWVVQQIKDGDYLKVRGSVQFDTFSRELVMMVSDLVEIEVSERKDLAEEKRVELHLHTSMSTMDGITPVKDVIK